MFVSSIGDVTTGEELVGATTGQELSGATIEEESGGARTGEELGKIGQVQVGQQLVVGLLDHVCN